MTTRQSAQEIEAEAADWLARLDRHGRTPDQLAALETWLAADARHRGALLQAQAAWNLICDQLAPQSAPPLQGRGSRGGVQPTSPEGRLESIAPGRDPTPIAYPTRRAFLWAGSAVAASIAAGTIFLVTAGEHYDTGLGEVRRVPLADGSVAAINTESTVEIAYGETERLVRITAGEAWFEVARDVRRPFVAAAGPVRVRALGTAFAVRLREGGADVAVTHGVVEAWAEGAEDRAVRLAAGQRAFIAPTRAAAAIRDVSVAEVDRTLAWRGGRIDLAGESLADAIEDFNRYNARKIVLADPRLRAEPLYGIFRTDDPEAFAEAISHGFDVPVDAAGQGPITIGRPATR